MEEGLKMIIRVFKRVIASGLILILAGCGDDGVSQIKDQIKNMVYDPESVEFRNIEIYRTGTTCGEVNAKKQVGMRGRVASVCSQEGKRRP